MSRILAIDYGQKRCGVAVSDPTQTIATGLDTVATKDLLAWLAAYMDREEVGRVVMGMPQRENGQMSDNAARVVQFIKQLNKRFPTLSVIEVDERYTSVLAHRTMLESGIGKVKRQDKALVDKISATIILQTYLETLRQ